MKQIKMNKTDLLVSEICYGADHFGFRIDRDTAFDILDRFRDVGGNLIDTANIYGRNFAEGYSVSELILGEYLKSRGKHSLIIATKGGHPHPDTDNAPRLNKAELTADINESLDSLGLDCLDFYWLHRDDPSMPIGEIIELLEEQRKAGKIRYYGASNYTVQRMLDGAKYAAEHSVQGFSAVSNCWSPAVPNVPLHNAHGLVVFDDNDLSLFDETGMAFLPYSSTAHGWFAKYANGTAGDHLNSVFENEKNVALCKELSQKGESVQTALLHHIRSYKQQIIPVTTVTKIEQLDDILNV